MTEQQTEKLDLVFFNMGFIKQELQPEKHLIDDLGLDSLDVVELTMECEKAFKISIPDEEPGNISTYGEWVNMIEKYLPAEKKAA